jgi:hypothetical protein
VGAWLSGAEGTPGRGCTVIVAVLVTLFILAGCFGAIDGCFDTQHRHTDRQAPAGPRR